MGAEINLLIYLVATTILSPYTNYTSNNQTNQDTDDETYKIELTNGNSEHQKHTLSLGPNAGTENEYKLCARSKKHRYTHPRTYTRKCVLRLPMTTVILSAHTHNSKLPNEDTKHLYNTQKHIPSLVPNTRKCVLTHGTLNGRHK